ncbi:hypothetical protein AALT_g8743 [Alternaria alternata]|nr:hypothetical protein AALT_g8743 [Alternaria alternata]
MPENEEMLEASDSNTKDDPSAREIRNLRRQAQLIATPNERPVATRKPKIAAPEKFRGDQEKLQTFLTYTDLYCEYNEVPTNQEKILIANDYLLDAEHQGTKEETRALFASWAEFKEEIGRIFGEVDAKNQAEKKITRLRQTASVSAYTAEFKQL